MASTSLQGRHYRTRASYSRDVHQGLTRRRGRKPTSRAGVSRSRVRPGGSGFAHSCGPWWPLTVCAAPAPPAAPGPAPANSASWSPSSASWHLPPERHLLSHRAKPTGDGIPGGLRQTEVPGRGRGVPGTLGLRLLPLSVDLPVLDTSHVNGTPRYMVSCDWLLSFRVMFSRALELWAFLLPSNVPRIDAPRSVYVLPRMDSGSASTRELWRWGRPCTGSMWTCVPVSLGCDCWVTGGSASNILRVRFPRQLRRLQSHHQR